MGSNPEYTPIGDDSTGCKTSWSAVPVSYKPRSFNTSRTVFADAPGLADCSDVGEDVDSGCDDVIPVDALVVNRTERDRWCTWRLWFLLRREKWPAGLKVDVGAADGMNEVDMTDLI